ncbi:DUF2835 domain-containing protein [Sedimenticola sp.]|uniref:DUF2835 domain-containing protein n=1 Tax=Sedimenticola sp. TaxID=1940285 RepID=UPI003D09AC03
MTQRYRFQLNLSAERFLHYYRGAARAVIVQAEDGRTIQLPANRLRPFVTASGIVGRFELTLDAQNKLIDLRRIT